MEWHSDSVEAVPYDPTVTPSKTLNPVERGMVK